MDVEHNKNETPKQETVSEVRKVPCNTVQLDTHFFTKQDFFNLTPQEKAIYKADEVIGEMNQFIPKDMRQNDLHPHFPYQAET